jgi:aryl-alcohol dehydrogenase-like predicted oxidoreductase
MQKRKLGKSNVKVSATVSAAWAFAEWSVVVVTVSEDQFSSWQQREH